MITAEQIRAARAILRITVLELSEKSGIGVATIKRLEAGRGVPSVHTRTLQGIQKALRVMGVEFIGAPDDRPGVCLIKSINSQMTKSPISRGSGGSQVPEDKKSK